MRYFKLLRAIFRTSLIADLEYRANLLVKLVVDVVWYLATISVFEVIYLHTDAIHGWTIEMMRVFMGMLFVVDSITMFFFHDNLEKVSDKIRKGELDLLLAKPVNAQFMLSFQRLNTAYFGNFIIAFGWLIYALSVLPGGFSWWRLAILFVSIPSGVTVAYCFKFLFCIPALLSVRAESFVYLWYAFFRFASRPDTIYPGPLRIVLLAIFPVAFIASVPARLLLEPLTVSLVLSVIAVPAALVLITSWVWKKALVGYTSASS